MTSCTIQLRERERKEDNSFLILKSCCRWWSNSGRSAKLFPHLNATPLFFSLSLSNANIYVFVWRDVCLAAGCCHSDSALIKRHKTNRCSQPHIEEGPAIKPAVWRAPLWGCSPTLGWTVCKMHRDLNLQCLICVHVRQCMCVCTMMTLAMVLIYKNSLKSLFHNSLITGGSLIAFWLEFGSRLVLYGTMIRNIFSFCGWRRTWRKHFHVWKPFFFFSF